VNPIPNSLQYVRPPLYPKQAAFVDSPARYTIVEASTKTGKTVACLIWLFEQALRGKAGQNFWWVAPTYSVAGIAFRRLKAWLRESGLAKGLWRAMEGDQAIDIAGRIIWFKGADRPDTLYGDDVFAAVVDEATRCKADSWPAVRSTLTATQGPVKIIGNVRGRHNWAYTLARRAEQGAKNMAYFRLTAWDAVDGGVLAREEVEDAKANLPDSVFRELYLAEPSEDGGNPFGISAIRKATGVMSHRDPVAFGVDLAKSQDWTVVCGLDEAGAVCVLERWQSDWGQTRRRVLDLVGGVPALVDSTGVGDPIVEDMAREAMNVTGFKFSSTSKQQIMEGLASAIQRRAVVIPAGWLQSELETFEFEYINSRVRYSAPDGLHDDGVCALALAVQCKTQAVQPWNADAVRSLFGTR
jgi:phage FluMu gp28-like protein